MLQYFVGIYLLYYTLIFFAKLRCEGELMNQKILVLTTVIFIAALSTASIFAAFTATAQTPSQTTPTVDTTYIAQNLNTTLIVTNNQTGITTVLLLRLAPDITGPSGIFVNNFSLMNTVIEFKVVSDSASKATG